MKVKTFSGGVCVPHLKGATAGKPIEELPPPASIVILLAQHTGAICEPQVEVGAYVKVGEKIGDSQSFISAPVHASISGKVLAIDKFPHPAIPTQVDGIRIETDGEDTWVDLSSRARYDNLTSEEIRSLVREAGIVGLGGAAFPTHVKITPPEGKRIEFLILNGAECEPYLTCDHRLMLERTAEILEGGRILMKALGVEKCYVGIEENKPDALAVMEEMAAAAADLEIVALKAKYPQGGEKQLIKAILGREVPSGGLPLDVGVVVSNVGTAFVVREAVLLGKPLVERAITVTGSGVKEPKNLKVRIGTTISSVAEACGGVSEDLAQLVVGGPMMGIAQGGLEVPVVKGTSGIIFIDEARLTYREPEACIRCGSCLDRCPISLVPTTIASFSEKERFQEALDYGVLDCIECGACSYICPSCRPLVQLLKYAKAEIRRRKLT